MPFLKISIDFYDKWNIAEYEHKCIIPLLQRYYKFSYNTSGTAAAGGLAKSFKHGGAGSKSRTGKFQQ